MEFILSLFGYRRCPCCKRFSFTVQKRRRSTAYQDEELNYLTACEECSDADFIYYQDLWRSYYGSRL